jgi:hypothetical protein
MKMYALAYYTKEKKDKEAADANGVTQDGYKGGRK